MLKALTDPKLLNSTVCTVDLLSVIYWAPSGMFTGMADVL